MFTGSSGVHGTMGSDRFLSICSNISIYTPSNVSEMYCTNDHLNDPLWSTRHLLGTF